MLFGEFSGALENSLTHDFSGCEFYDRARRDDDFLIGLLGIAADALLCKEGFENAKLAQFHSLAVCERLCDSIKSELDDRENFLLDEAGFFGDCDDEIALREVRHGVVVGHFKRLGNVNRHWHSHPPGTRSRDGFPRAERTRLGAE